MPNLYLGNEIWDFSLVDPDNRRPVDYAKRREMLNCLSRSKPEELLRNSPDSRIKMFLTQRLLQFRREHVDLFQRGDYVPLRATGTFADCCVSFARALNDQWIIVIAPRLSSRVGFAPIGDKWQDTSVDLASVAGMADPGAAINDHGYSMRELFMNRPVPI